METFETLTALSSFRRRHLPFIRTLEDLDLVRVIGASQATDRPLTLKLVFLEGIGTVATIQRRLHRLKRLGVVEQTRSKSDRRNLILTVNPEICRIYARIGRLLRAKFASKKKSEMNHNRVGRVARN